MIKTSEGLVFPDEHIINTLPKLLDCAPEDIFFVDIETTGLSPKNSDIYLIGVAYYDKHNWHVCQFFAENSSQEEEVLKAFSAFVKSFT